MESVTGWETFGRRSGGVGDPRRARGAAGARTHAERGEQSLAAHGSMGWLAHHDRILIGFAGLRADGNLDPLPKGSQETKQAVDLVAFNAATK